MLVIRPVSDIYNIKHNRQPSDLTVWIVFALFLFVSVSLWLLYDGSKACLFIYWFIFVSWHNHPVLRCTLLVVYILSVNWWTVLKVYYAGLFRSCLETNNSKIGSSFSAGVQVNLLKLEIWLLPISSWWVYLSVCCVCVCGCFWYVTFNVTNALKGGGQ